MVLFFSLLMFNIGVEAGQLFFVALILAMLQSFRVLEIYWPRWAELTPSVRWAHSGRFNGPS